MRPGGEAAVRLVVPSSGLRLTAPIASSRLVTYMATPERCYSDLIKDSNRPQDEGHLF